jgi:hypothetical protein
VKKLKKIGKFIWKVFTILYFIDLAIKVVQGWYYIVSEIIDFFKKQPEVSTSEILDRR